VFEHLGEHPITINDVEIDPVTGVEKPKDYVLTNRNDVGKRQRLDYIFFAQKVQRRASYSLLASHIFQANPEERQFDLALQLAEVQPFFVKHPLFTQLSDHYAVTA
jgi:hypothetical protein